ncbi:MAG TPA: ribosomal protein L7/L12 [Ktedonobacterales bacterium]|nr:ribosomal protein L7/L12 [Ktedonobacterales bacterium]
MLKRALLFAGVLAVLLPLLFDEGDYNARLTRLEAMMHLVLQRLGIDPNTALTGPSEHLKQLLLRGKKIEAIKVYREQTGTGLKEAKDYIDALERQMRGY